MAKATGYTTFRGMRACVCVAEWIPVYEAMCRKRGITSGFYDGKTLKLFQLTGSAAASAGTHSQGGAIDSAMLDPNGIRLAREMGASASWRRLWAGNLHSHFVLDGCPHNSPARYQVSAVKKGYDGTGWMGYGSKDTEWRPAKWRTWEQGLTWAAGELGLASAIEGILDMQLTDKVPGTARLSDDGKTDLTVGQCLSRGAWAYQQSMEGGSIRTLANRGNWAYHALLGKGYIAQRLAALEAKVKGN